MLDTPIREILHNQELLELPGDRTVADAAKEMIERHVGTALVRDAGRLAGIVTERDILERVVAAGLNPSDTDLKSAMTPDPVGIAADQSLLTAVFSMRDQGTRHLIVREGNRMTGILSISDLLRFLVDDGMNDRRMVETLWDGFPV